MQTQVKIVLTEEQRRIIQPLLDQAALAKQEGRMGIVLGQAGCYTDKPDEAYFAFVPHETSMEIQKIINPRMYKIQNEKGV